MKKSAYTVNYDHLNCCENLVRTSDDTIIASLSPHTPEDHTFGRDLVGALVELNRLAGMLEK